MVKERSEYSLTVPLPDTKISAGSLEKTCFIIFCYFFQIFWEMFCQIKKISHINFYRNLGMWFDLSMTLISDRSLNRVREGCWDARNVPLSVKKFLEGPSDYLKGLTEFLHLEKSFFDIHFKKKCL